MMKIDNFYVENFRKFKKFNFRLGSRITVLSGVNGVGKSSLLSLIASTTGTKAKRLNGAQFQPEFNEYFKISPTEKFKDYKLSITFSTAKVSFAKRISFRDDTKTNRGIRPLPRTCSPEGSNLSNKKAAQVLKEKLNIGDSSRAPIPTIYLSLSRLYPLGEHELSKHNEYHIIYRNSNIYKNKLYEKYAEFYNMVLPGSIDFKTDQMSLVTKAVTKKVHIKMDIIGTTNETISVGEDNLSSIISCLLDFYNLKITNKNYTGGVLCIDEVDASLHPGAIINLIGLLDNLSKELNLQIILTSHSLVVLNEILRLQSSNPSDYQLVYFKDRNIPAPTYFKDYTSLKANLYDETRSSIPMVKVYAEDDQTVATLNLLIKAYKDLFIINNIDNTKYPNLPNFKPIALHLGKEQLRQLQVNDAYFKQVVLLLDGDGHLEGNLDIKRAYMDEKYLKEIAPRENDLFNAISLPTVFPPELFLFNIIREYANNPSKHYKFWRDLDKNSKIHTMYTTDQIQNKFETKSKNIDKSFFESNLKKKLQTEIFDFSKETDILTDYYNQTEVQNELVDFMKEFINKINNASKMIKSNNL
ncbi:AAA family ATPase [Lactobacillus sp. ESL0225]|uniref:AAA family ATPase n=1 Tax=Lactobacillus sp. ESL0225 TaxID=2069351 RepID=UPI000EFB46F5|nr:AAA family ATPase [Lactobacillus sp. ESL0225]RMC50862.1 hypothetical protein F5ESL0225_04545 [Lactobacillus sp. ESL0225]